MLALEALGVNVLALCPDPIDASGAAGEARERLCGKVLRCGRTQFKRLNVPVRRFLSLRPSRIGAMDWTLRHFTGIEDQIGKWARESTEQISGIYYNTIYDSDFEWIRWVEPFLRMPWAGLYVHALSFRMPGRPNPNTGKVPRPERMFGGRLCKGICILDEGIVAKVSESLGKRVIAMPDFTDERPAVNAAHRNLGQRLREFAAGRPIVGLFGHLHASKGIATFLEAARRIAGSEICFALGGEILWFYQEEEASRIRSTLAECPHVWNHLARIPNEACLNDLMRACDVIFAAYLDFPHSSNMQTKAAVLKKPLIVSDGYLMAERVRRFNMGEVIPQGDTSALIDAILKIAQDPAAWVTDNKPQWEEYCREHSFDRLKAALTQLFDSI